MENVEKYEISENLANAYKEYQKAFKEEIDNLCKELHPNYEILGMWERLNIHDQAKIIIIKKMYGDNY